MRLLILSILSLIFYSCADNKKAENQTKKNVEVTIRNEKTNLDIFYGNEFFENNEANKLNTKGIKFVKENKFKKAEKHFLDAYRLEPQNPTILNNLGNIYREIGTDKMALEYFNEALLVSDSTYFNAAYNMGISYCNTKEYEKSERILNYIISNVADEIEITFAKYELVRVYVNQEKCAKAKKLYAKMKSDLDQFPKFNANRKKLEQKIENCVQQRITQNG